MVSPSEPRPRLAQDFIDEHARERCALAIAELAYEKGEVEGVGTTEIVLRAKMGRNTFYKLFPTRNEALRYAFESAQRRLLEPVRAAAGLPGTWTERLEGAIAALLTAAATEPAWAELCLVHSVTLPPNAPGLHDPVTTSTLAELLAEGRCLHPERELAFEDFVAGGIVSIVAMRLRRREAASLPELHGQLVHLATTLLSDRSDSPAAEQTHPLRAA